MTEEVEIRPLRTTAEYQACVQLQRQTWGATFSELVPVAILRVSQRIGGVTAGAFDPEGRLLGFVFGMTGIQDGVPVHWSDMLAVRRELRDSGLGRRLKEFQREQVLRLGVGRMFWTFDPLVSKNAYLNIHRLGARPVEYVTDMYGSDTDSEMHRGLGTDRFVIAWELRRSEAPGLGTDEANGDARHRPLLNPLGPDGEPTVREEVDFLLEPVLRVQVPEDIARVQADSLERAARWRLSTRTAFLAALDRGYRVVDFLRGEAGELPFYVLARDTSSTSR